MPKIKEDESVVEKKIATEKAVKPVVPEPKAVEDQKK